MSFAHPMENIDLKRAKSFSNRAFAQNMPHTPSKLGMEQSVLKSPASSANFFTRTEAKLSFRNTRKEYQRGSLSKSQSMRVPPGFEPSFDANSLLDLAENDLSSDLLDLDLNPKPREKELRRFVTFANLKTNKKSSFRISPSEFSDDEDVDVSVIEDESLIDIAGVSERDSIRQVSKTLFEPVNVDMHSFGSTSTTTSNSPQKKPVRHSQNDQSYHTSPPSQSFNGRFQGNRFQESPPQPHTSPQNYQEQDFMAQNRMLMDLVMKQNALLQQQQQQFTRNQFQPMPGQQMPMNQQFGYQHPQAQIQNPYSPQNLNFQAGHVHAGGVPNMNQMNPRQGFRSPGMVPMATNLLARHKTQGYRPNVNELRGNVLEFAKDSHGSRLIQSLMGSANPEEKKILIAEVLNEAITLMQDLFGNYVIQNFLEHCSVEQKNFLTLEIKKNMNILSFQPHGCRVVQRAIDILPSKDRNLLLEEIIFPDETILKCSKDPHATHVLQKGVVLLQKELLSKHTPLEINAVNERILESLERALSKEVLQLAVHPHACRLVQKVLGDCNMKKSDYIQTMLTEINQVYPNLAKDQHGNFILQHILDNGSREQKRQIQIYVCSKFLDLAQHKFGSHLLEKCLNTATEEDSVNLVTELLKLSTRHNQGSGREDTLLSLMKDPYANFVVQRAFDVSKGDQREALVMEIQRRSEILSRFTYGRHILSHVNKKSNNVYNRS